MSLILDGTNGITFPDSTVKYGNIPQITTYTSGSGTYTTPTGAKYLVVEMVGAGGGGGGSGTSGGGTGGTGGTTTFGTSLLTCVGGFGGPWGGAGTSGGAGGSATISSPAVGFSNTGNTGASYPGGYNGSYIYTAGSQGGESILGTATTAAGGNGTGGAGGYSSGTSLVVGLGGGAGGYIKAMITSPSATYSYAVGAAGTAGTAGTSGFTGFVGGAGVIIITAYF